ncbi:hypothetical protein EXS57_03295 [Candidatus Kaiserbacteria bacterium]|nr:hypothetical protein [Candidatus Kaiserbacteria bacterium]
MTEATGGSKRSRIEARQDIEGALERVRELAKKMREMAGGNNYASPQELLKTAARLETEVNILHSGIEDVQKPVGGRKRGPKSRGLSAVEI